MDSTSLIPPGFMRWQRERYTIAVAMQGHGFTDHVDGATYRGLGLSGGVNWWTVTHLGSGHIVTMLNCDKRTAFQLATELAERFDWSFGGLQGWKNLDPDLDKKVALWFAAHRGVARKATGSSNSEVASRIAVSRW